MDILPYGRISSYIDFLTLLSIGGEKRSRLYSLIAELHLYVDRVNVLGTVEDALESIDRTEKSWDPNRPDRYVGIVDGINSGIWKYRCYQDKQLISSCLSSLVHTDSRLIPIKMNYSKVVSSQDQNEGYEQFIDDCGDLLCRIGSVVNAAYKKKHHTSCPRLKEKVDEIDDVTIAEFRYLKVKAEFLIAKCNLSIKNDANNSSGEDVYEDFSIVLDPHYTQKKGRKVVFSDKKDSALNYCYLNHDNIISPETTIIQGNLNSPWLGFVVNGNDAAGGIFEKLLLNIYDKLGEQKTGKLVFIANGDINDNTAKRIESGEVAINVTIYNNPVFYPNQNVTNYNICMKDLDNSQVQIGSSNSKQEQIKKDPEKDNKGKNEEQ